MGENEIRINAGELDRLWVRCDHCQSEIVFNGASDQGPGEDIRCANCGMLMANVARLVLAYRQFFRSFTEQKTRKAGFILKGTD